MGSDVDWALDGGPLDITDDDMGDGKVAVVSEPFTDLIPTRIDQNPWAHSLRPMDMIFHGWSMSLFQASQERLTISS